jgi:urease accessory protein
MGRAAHGEEMASGHIADHWRVRKDNRLIWADCFRVGNDVFPHLNRSALLSDCKAIGTLIYFGPYAHSGLGHLRDAISSLECRCAMTSVGGLTIMRFAAAYSSGLKLALRSVLRQFNRELGPGPFRVPKMWSC